MDNKNFNSAVPSGFESNGEQRNVSCGELVELENKFNEQVEKFQISFDSEEERQEALSDFTQQYINGNDDPQINFVNNQDTYSVEKFIEKLNRMSKENPYLTSDIKEEYIHLNTFDVKFQKECLIERGAVLAVKKADYDVINLNENHEIKISFAVIDKKYYTDKPGQFTNFTSDDNVCSSVREFNEFPPEWMEFIEHSDKTGSPILTTKYWGLRITKIEFPEYHCKNNLVKYYTVTICYDWKETYQGFHGEWTIY